MFGQFQSRRRREVLLGFDDMLNGFEDVKRKNGEVQGFTVNPLSSIDFSAVLESLGYETKSSGELGFVKRNIHFAGACARGQNIDFLELKELIGDAIPDDNGMVRISTEPPRRFAQSELLFEERYFDVPAARLSPQSEEIEIDCGSIPRIFEAYAHQQVQGSQMLKCKGSLG